MSAIDDLTQKQRDWVLAYVGPALGNATEACRIAGYKGTENALAVQGNANLNHPKIKAALADLAVEVRAKAAKAREGAIASAAEVQQYLTAVMRGEAFEVQAIDEDGEAINGPAKIRDRLKATELLAKCHGLLIDRKHHTGGKSLEELPDGELRAIIDDDEGGDEDG